jgi:hypothetical protein
MPRRIRLAAAVMSSRTTRAWPDGTADCTEQSGAGVAVRGPNDRAAVFDQVGALEPHERAIGVADLALMAYVEPLS